MSEDELLSALISSKPVKKGKKPKTNFSKARIQKIRKEFNESRYKFSKLKIKEIRKNLYKIENEKNLSESKIKEIERILTELGENLFKTKKYYDADLESLLEKMKTCHNNPEKLSITKINKHTPSGYSLFTHCSLDTTKNKLD